MTGTILFFRDDVERPHCEIALAGGERVSLALDRGGLVVAKEGPAGAAKLLFRAPAELVSLICAGLVGPQRHSHASPLSLLAAMVVRIDTPAEVEAAFRDLEETLS